MKKERYGAGDPFFLNIEKTTIPNVEKILTMRIIEADIKHHERSGLSTMVRPNVIYFGKKNKPFNRVTAKQEKIKIKLLVLFQDIRSAKIEKAIIKNGYVI